MDEENKGGTKAIPEQIGKSISMSGEVTTLETPVSNKMNEKENTMAKRALTAVNFFVETNRLEPYTAVYLINVIGWNEVNFGIVSLVMNMAMLIFQTPAGDLVDKTKKSKKFVTTFAIVVAAVTTVMVVWTSNFWVILVGKTVEGLSATIFLPALISLLLGICRTDAEVPSFIATTEVSNKVGSCLIVCVCAAISYFAYPNVESMFYLLGGGGLAAAFFTMIIPESQIDHDRARQLGKAGDESPEREEVVKKKEDGEKKTPSRYLDLFRNRSLLFFSALTFSYHLANASVAILLAQYVASISREDTSLTWASAILIVYFFAQSITAYLMSYAVDRFDDKKITCVALAVLPIRCTLICLLVSYFNNPWALVATQIGDGIGGGVYDIMLPIIVKKMVAGTGRFGFSFGFVVTMWRIGHGFSLLLGETIVHGFGYTAAFGSLGSLGLLNLLCFVVFFNFDPLEDSDEKTLAEAAMEAGEANTKADATKESDAASRDFILDVYSRSIGGFSGSSSCLSVQRSSVNLSSGTSSRRLSVRKSSIRSSTSSSGKRSSEPQSVEAKRALFARIKTAAGSEEMALG